MFTENEAGLGGSSYFEKGLADEPALACDNRASQSRLRRNNPSRQKMTSCGCAEAESAKSGPAKLDDMVFLGKQAFHGDH
jgi:hypothetical protein